MHAYIYKDPSGDDPIEIVCLEEENGVWRTKGPKSWEGCYYVYEVCVYHPSTMRIEKCYTSDPYARGYALFMLVCHQLSLANYFYTLDSSIHE